VPPACRTRPRCLLPGAAIQAATAPAATRPPTRPPPPPPPQALQGLAPSAEEERTIGAVARRVLAQAESCSLVTEVGPPDGVRLAPPSVARLAGYQGRLRRQAALARRRAAKRAELGYGQGGGAEGRRGPGMVGRLLGAVGGLAGLVGGALGLGRRRQGPEAGPEEAALAEGAPEAAYRLLAAELDVQLMLQLRQLPGPAVAVAPLLQLDGAVEQWRAASAAEDA
jgi:hypothetical protein